MITGTNGPYFIKSEGRTNGTYIRVGATNRVADPNRIKALELRSMNMSFDGLDCPSVKADKQTVKDLCDHLSSFKGIVMQTDLLNMGVIKEGSVGYLATNAFALLTKNPFIHARVQCARFRGNDDLVFQDSKDFTGDIVEQVVGALDFVLNNIQMHSKIDGLVREDYYEIPKNALREAIANAVLHREYLMTDSSVFVKVFDDRIEIESPGLPLGLNMSDVVSGRSMIRNQVIAYVFKAIGFIERYGTGIRRMIAECEQNNVPKPKFTTDDEFFKVTFIRPGAQKTKIVSKKTFRSMDEKKDAILDLLEDKDSRYTQADISEITGLSKSDIKRIMLDLKKEGILERKGNQRSGEWIVNRK
jgi:ATP-dependent DNA helicase RecG